MPLLRHCDARHVSLLHGNILHRLRWRHGLDHAASVDLLALRTDELFRRERLSRRRRLFRHLVGWRLDWLDTLAR